MEPLAQALWFPVWLFLALLFLVFPWVLTVGNGYNLFAKTSFWEPLIHRITFVLGPLGMCLLWWLWSAPDWDVPLYDHFEPYLHAPLASWHLPAILALSVWALAGAWALSLGKGRLPPLPVALSISAVEVGMLLAAAVLVQLFPRLDEGVLFFPDCLYMALFPINYLLIAARLLREEMGRQTRRMAQAPPAPEKRLVCLCRRILCRSLGWLTAGFLLALPVLALLLGVLILFGQAPDAAVRAFTETSDWTLSQKISPPPIEYDGHYLCTVAVGGHPKLVKPLRYGLRHGRRIVVNRQLCVANAFEQLLMERTPRLHRAVRRFYDEHGYPLSQKLTTPLRADLTYLWMKPLEWLFLLCLYTFDEKPENRIAMQYTGK